MLIDLIQETLARCQAASKVGKYAESVQILDELRALFRTSPPSFEDVSHLFQEIIGNPSMQGASLVFVAAWFNLSQNYVPLLCKILSDERLAASHEQAIELLGKLQNPDAVPSLAKSLNYRWDFDEWLDIPRKALRSLVTIGTEEALTVVKHATQSDVPEIRNEAAQLWELL